jgi:membrane fusion protein (multidrug efflux system)
MTRISHVPFDNRSRESTRYRAVTKGSGLGILLLLSCLSGPLAQTAWAQKVELVPVVSKTVARTSGFVDRIAVDRGSVVKKGDLLAELSAPEMAAQIAEAESKVQAGNADRLQAEAQLAAAQSTYERMKTAAQTPGAIAANELIQAEELAKAARALLNSRQQAVRAAESTVRALREMQEYLKITAPFDGVVTDRLVHPGALVGPGNDVVLLVIQQVSRLRLVVPVPEEDVGGIMEGVSVPFRTPAHPERSYSGTIARISHALDQKTRTMPVELDVMNPDGSLAPGMYPTVKWPVRRALPALLVPKTSVVTTTERMFVIRDQNGRAEWVDVRRGFTDGDLVEVIGGVHPGDRVVRRATDEVREGAKLEAAR